MDLIGAHVQKDDSKDKNWYIYPLCGKHNATKEKSLEVSDIYELVSANVSETCGWEAGTEVRGGGQTERTKEGEKVGAGGPRKYRDKLRTEGKKLRRSEGEPARQPADKKTCPGLPFYLKPWR
jgi:hypothetical protein